MEKLKAIYIGKKVYEAFRLRKTVDAKVYPEIREGAKGRVAKNEFCVCEKCDPKTIFRDEFGNTRPHRPYTFYPTQWLGYCFDIREDEFILVPEKQKKK